jgi:hypothetical protein
MSSGSHLDWRVDVQSIAVSSAYGTVEQNTTMNLRNGQREKSSIKYVISGFSAGTSSTAKKPGIMKIL